MKRSLEADHKKEANEKIHIMPGAQNVRYVLKFYAQKF